MFTYDDATPKPSKKIASATIVFSSLATAEWHWERGQWVRYLDGSPMTLENGDAIATDNVVIQQVETEASTEFSDVADYPSPEVSVTGSGKAWVLRDGKLIVGTWERASEGDLTVFRTRKGDEIALDPRHDLRGARADGDVRRLDLLREVAVGGRGAPLPG